MTPQTLDMQTVLERLARVEARGRRLARLAAALLIAAGAALVMGQVSPKARTLEAEGFFLRDAGGKVRAVLGILADGSPGLALHGADGTPRLGLTVTARGPHVVLYDEEGKARAGLTVGPDGSAALGLYDKDGRGRAGLTVLPGGASALALADRAGKARAGLTVTAEGTPALVLYDRDEKARARLALVGSGTPELAFYDREGKTTWRTP